MRGDAGQTTLEYALLVAVVCLTLVGLLVGIGTDVMDDALTRFGELAGT